MFERLITKNEKPTFDEFLKQKEGEMNAIQERLNAKLDEMEENTKKLLEITAEGDAEKAAEAIKLLERHRKIGAEFNQIQAELDEKASSLEAESRDYINN